MDIPIGKFRGHPLDPGRACPICTKSDDLFGTAHVPGPPCTECGDVNMVEDELVDGTPMWVCPQCLGSYEADHGD